MAQTRKVALITGSGRNIGRAVALGTAQDGFDVVINGSSDRAACEAVAQEARTLGVAALVVMGDVGRAEDCARIVAEATAGLGPVDVLVNNAAIRPAVPFLDTTEATGAGPLRRHGGGALAGAGMPARHAGARLGPHHQLHRHERHPGL
ncbi:SDR family NAD(P)-dependent oxidoreductase [Teichococcus aestuarii]|uniref:SDR family NAD(P)-dependent oxidoreductase n=1 Tax=Teichococcus aestuarii TaxID=568898 RepID=UPI0036199A2E